jgi:hypothetical protein
MAQTGYTPILIYSSSTVSAAPTAGNLTNSTLGSELAINITDGKLFYKDNANAVQVIGWKTVPTSAGGTGLTSYTAGDLIYYASGATFTKLAIGSAYQALQVNAGGTAPSWQPSASSVLTAQGDLLYASAANTLARLAKNTTATRYLANTGTSNNPDWAQINLANGVTGTLPVANGGTGITSFGTGVATALGQNVTGSGGIVLASSPQLLNGAELYSVGATANATIKYFNSSKNWYVGLRGDTSNVWSIADDSAFRFVVDSSGNVLVATTAQIADEKFGVLQTANARGIAVNTNNASFTGTSMTLYANRNTTNNTFYYFQCFNSAAGNNRFLIADSGQITSQGSYDNTTASAANLFVTSGGLFQRSTSSIKYKTQIESIEHEKADAILSMRPVWYRSTCNADNPNWSWYGLIAEEVAKIEPRLVHWGYNDSDYEVIEIEQELQKERAVVDDTGKELIEIYSEVETKRERKLKADAQLSPEGVQYDRMTVLLLDIVKRQQLRLETLEIEIKALKGAA